MNHFCKNVLICSYAVFSLACSHSKKPAELKPEDGAPVQELSVASLKAAPQVAKEKLLDAIVSNYQGQVVLVDFWATWCTPCLMAMHEIAPLKEEMKAQHVAFVYITGSTSPRADFEARMKSIAGDHYYLTEEEWTYLLQTLDINGIPTYRIYDTKGKLQNMFTGYPGTQEMRQLLGKYFSPQA
ncbi:MAG: TlpA family protein disulfide reductase [Candidatus Symbiothrix sp.]|jgi:thiol-disulfide isomerase/thioredoxin|nr:TlpA family protein disulfide reductase [Candidatus Symbiothrix sp.]